jgi:hypothetical protein
MNVNKYIFDANERRKNDITKSSSEKVINPFFKGVVTNVLFDEDSSDSSEFYSKATDVLPTNQSFRIPKNSLIARIIDDGVDLIGSESRSNFVVAYPFFSSHLCLPAKVGETVWIVFDSNSKHKGYWISRVVGDEFSEDLNFSHFDRSQATVPSVPEIYQTPGTYEKSRGVSMTFQDLQRENAPENDFPNISLDAGFENYDQIFSNLNVDINKLEPVPRYKKRPGDLVIQGSNNALIALTTNRGWKKSDSLEGSSSNVNEVVDDFSGTIDVVTGRSRKILNENERGTRTVPNTYLNDRGYEEVVKEGYQGEVNPTEGDPDFLNDAARVYISSKTKVDESFEINDETPIPPGDTQPTIPSEESAAIALKADEIRIIARKDESSGINGSITILKEGESSNDNCSIRLQSDGTILISGDRVFIGRSPANGGLSEGPSSSPDRVQPFVKYQQLEDLMNNIISDINSFCDTMLTHVTPGFGAPSPQILQAATELKAKINQRRSEIPPLQSKRIFGE